MGIVPVYTELYDVTAPRGAVLEEAVRASR